MKLINICIMAAVISAGAEAALLPQERNASAQLQTETLCVPAEPGNHQAEGLRQIARKAYANNSEVSIHAQYHQQSAAGQIKKYLIAQGIRADNIRIDPVTAPTHLHKDLLKISIKTITFRRKHCDYSQQDYRYSDEQKPGCAVKHNLQQSLVFPARSIF